MWGHFVRQKLGKDVTIFMEDPLIFWVVQLYDMLY